MSSIAFSLSNRQITNVYRNDDTGRVTVEFGYHATLYLDQADVDRLAPFVTKETQP